MERIQLPRHLVNQLLHQAQLSPDQEICGLISAKHNQPLHCYPISNIAAQPGHRYQMDPRQQIAALKAMRDQGENLFAIYHSHPTAAALPSLIDIQEANYPDVLYLIISLNTLGVLEMRGFYIRQQNVVENTIEIY